MNEPLTPSDAGFTAYPTAVTYTVLEKSLIGNQLYEAGETARYDGLPAENLAPTCDEGRARYADYLATNKARIARMNSMYSEQAAAGDPAAFQKAVAEAIAASNLEHDKRMADLADVVASMADTQKELLAQLTSYKLPKAKAAAPATADAAADSTIA